MFGIFSKIKRALTKTRSAISGRITNLFKGPINEETFEELEQILYEADLGSEYAMELVEETRRFLKKNREAKIDEILSFLQEKALDALNSPTQVEKRSGTPHVILVVGVNGSGKTTSIARLAKKLKSEGKSVLLAAGDTFRAAAIEQLTTWAERLDLPIIKSTPGGDPAAVAFDAVTSAKAKGVDVVLIDTAGRLQNKTDLMRELEKVVTVIKKVAPDAPHETLLVLDATTGQNAVDQAEIFHSFTPLTGIVLAKLDGSAKGGIVLSIYKKLGIPVQWVGIGEKEDDFMAFDPKAYSEALFAK
ncbi:MAG: signal recognition particle-docking protein FtsY [Simkaniaceae bacterium]|nr:signal recognition particle-docking protein FtsY [Candidatus Sacchlamyda saccharinae]